MNTGVLYCSARRTAYCQELLSRSGFELTQECACAGHNPIPRLGYLLQKNQLVLVLGPERSGEPVYGKPFFQALHVPMLGESPQGVLMLHGTECTGWLIESREQAVALLPDHPRHLRTLIPELWLRISRKFDVPQPESAKPAIHFEKLTERDFVRKEQK